jgi:hypothetical protein
VCVDNVWVYSRGVIESNEEDAIEEDGDMELDM